MTRTNKANFNGLTATERGDTKSSDQGAKCCRRVDKETVRHVEHTDERTGSVVHSQVFVLMGHHEQHLILKESPSDRLNEWGNFFFCR